MGAAESIIALDDAAQMREALRSIASDDDPNQLINTVVKLLLKLSGENKLLQLRLAKALRGLHGRKSEKLSKKQLALFRELLDDAGEQPDEKAERSADGERKPKKKRKAAPHGRGKLPDHLPRVDNVIPVPEADRVCSVCGAQKACIGHETSERLDYVPAQLRVMRDMREKVACRPCAGEVAVAPTAPKVIEGGMAAEGLLAHVCVSKFLDGLTLTRLAKIYARSGVTIAESTLGDFVRGVSHQLLFLAKHIEERALSHYVVHQDDTGLRVLDRDHPKGIKRGRIWAYCGERWIVYRYTPDWRGEHPRSVLANYAGIVQGDGYAGINALFDGEASKATRAGCMMHCRRYFFDAHKAGDPRAGIALALIAEVYQIESLAKEQKLAAPARQKFRQERSLPLMLRLKRWIEDISGSAPPKTPLGKAVTYATNQWKPLLVPFSDGRLEIDNGEAERRLKVLAIGRKNWLFAGSDSGAERIATILTVLGTAVAHGADPLAYLTYVLRRIAEGIAASNVAELLPDVWAQQHGQDTDAGQAAIPRLVV